MAAAHALVPEEPDDLRQAAPLLRIVVPDGSFLIVHDEAFGGLVEEVDLDEGSLDDCSLRGLLFGLLQEVVDISSGSDDCDVPEGSHGGLQLMEGVFGQVGVGFLKLVLGEDELEFIGEVVLVDGLQAVGVDCEQGLTVCLLQAFLLPQ
jgi:hypothetical protein